MKTDLVEIFQTIRASLYSYQTRGYSVHEDSDVTYELYSEKNREYNGEKITEFFFLGLYIQDDKVNLKLNTSDLDIEENELFNFDDNTSGFSISQLDKDKQTEISTFIEIIHTHFKKEEWV